MGLALYLCSIAVWHLSEQADNKVQNDCEHNADYDGAHDRNEELKVPSMYEYIAGKLAQKRNSLPEEQ
jgi:hypothetical protein